MTYLRLLLVHPKVKLILVPVGRLLTQPRQAVLLGVVVPGTQDIVFVFLENTESLAMCELPALLVISAV